MQIVNQGTDILWTDYWESDRAKAGALFLSVVQNAFRLLVPSRALGELTLDAEIAVVSRGPMEELGLSDAFEVLLDDRTTTPWCALLAPDAVEPLPPDETAGLGWTLCVVTDAGDGGARPLLVLPCTYRLRRNPDPLCGGGR